MTWIRKYIRILYRIFDFWNNLGIEGPITESKVRCNGPYIPGKFIYFSYNLIGIMLSAHIVSFFKNNDFHISVVVYIDLADLECGIN